MYLFLIPIGLGICFILLWVSSSKARYYRTPINEEETKDFKKPFRFAFWLSIMIVSIVFLCAFVPLAYLQSSLLRGAAL